MPRLTDVRVNALLQRLANKATFVQNVPEEFHYQRDPKDEMYLNLAIVTNATYLVSRDKDLLDLMNDSTDVARQFRGRFSFLSIMTAADFVRQIEKASEK